MSPTKTVQSFALASVSLLDAYTDFILSRQAMNATAVTMSFYRFTAGKFLQWIEGQNVTSPEQVTARHVRQFLAELINRGLQDTTRHDYARAIRTLLRFWHKEGYISQLITFDMPKLAKKRLPVLTADELRTVVAACNKRDKAIVYFMADSGLRRAEVVSLNWADVDMQSGLVKVRQGKGNKDRSSVIGARTRRALLAYRRNSVNVTELSPLFQTKQGTRFTHSGFIRIFQKLTRITGIHVTAHALRRTFVILALRAGMRLSHLKAMGGWEDPEMIEHYAQMVDEDLLTEHRAHSPVDNL